MHSTGWGLSVSRPSLRLGALLGLLIAAGCGSSGSSNAGSTGDSGVSGQGTSTGGGATSDDGGGSGGSGASGASGATAGSGGTSATGGTGSTGGAATGTTGGSTGDAGQGGTAGEGGTGGSTGDGGTSSACGAGDANLPAEPTIPAACTTLTASQAVASGALPSETTLDTTRIQSALNACKSGQAVKLTASGSDDAFVSGPLTLPSGVSLWVDASTTLYGSRSAAVYGSTCSQSGGSCSALITAGGTGSGVYGDGIIDGQGGEEILGMTTSWWDLTGTTNGDSANPKLIDVEGATNFTLYRITLHNSPKFHVSLASKGFVVWGITIKTPSKAMNAQGEALTPAGAHNTDGVDPGEAASDGYIVCSNISDGDDNVAIKGGTSVTNLTIAHDHFGAGHGMSIGSETNGGVSGVNVYDLSIDGTFGGTKGNENGIRIKSDPAVGGPVTDVTYTDVCVRETENVIQLTPNYNSSTGTSIPVYTGITIRDFRYVSSTVKPVVTIDGYDASHLTTLTLDNVVVDGITSANVLATDATVTLGPGAVNFTPSGTGVTVKNNVSGTSTPNACDGKWVTF